MEMETGVQYNGALPCVELYREALVTVELPSDESRIPDDSFPPNSQERMIEWVGD